MLSDHWTNSGAERGLRRLSWVRASVVRWLPQLLLSPHRVLTSGHQPSSVLRSPAMGTLGGDFLSSLPLHEYPPAFPLGADIQGRTLITRLGCSCHICPQTRSEPRSFSKPSGSPAKAIIRGTSLGFFGHEGVRQESDFDFSFLTRFRFIFFPPD